MLKEQLSSGRNGPGTVRSTALGQRDVTREDNTLAYRSAMWFRGTSNCDTIC